VSGNAFFIVFFGSIAQNTLANYIEEAFMFGLFKPVAHIERLPEGQIDPIYKSLRW
jgi:hypothetical protein